MPLDVLKRLINKYIETTMDPDLLDLILKLLMREGSQ